MKIVKIHKDLTQDLLNKQGEIGIIKKMDGPDLALIEFLDGQSGWYESDTYEEQSKESAWRELMRMAKLADERSTLVKEINKFKENSLTKEEKDLIIESLQTLSSRGSISKLVKQVKLVSSVITKLKLDVL